MLFPAVKRVKGNGELYACRWEDGTQSQESFASAYAAFEECDGTRIFLNREGRTGEINLSPRFTAYFQTLLCGALPEVLALDASAVNTLERVALWRRFCGRAWWWDNAFYVWTEEGAAQTSDARCDELIVESASLTATALKRTGAKSVEVRAEADFSAGMLVGTSVASLSGVEPYFTENGALYLQTAGGVRLVACPPQALVFEGTGYDFADEGALLPCENLQSLRVPFAGNSRYTLIENYRPELAVLFVRNGEYFVPSSLKRVEIAGGAIAAATFYGCERLEEITLCGVKAAQISRNSFENLKNLRVLHAPIANAKLNGNFSRRTLGCGCTLYEKEV